eukprot:TRINITY_DN8260_c0_g1_i1.p1 TRINITY_DN8260_c0_g1~~TRINITY_DN8260_c0_g1_i1.p1  ORF type:complete len:1054 (+),score=263.54 TRINITY_DN8260_c0_g1_i1:166-3327(+)
MGCGASTLPPADRELTAFDLPRDEAFAAQQGDHRSGSPQRWPVNAGATPPSGRELDGAGQDGLLGNYNAILDSPLKPGAHVQQVQPADHKLATPTGVGHGTQVLTDSYAKLPPIPQCGGHLQLPGRFGWEQHSSDDFGSPQRCESGGSSMSKDSLVGRTVEVVFDGPGLQWTNSGDDLHEAAGDGRYRAHFELRRAQVPNKVCITPTVAVSKDSLGNETVNEYTKLRNLGQGSFGSVDLVVCQGAGTSCQSLYAMKTCKRPSGAILTSECFILLRLQHPNIVSLHEVIDDCDHHEIYLIMEYLEGGCVMTIGPDGKAEQPALTEQEASSYTQQIASGLEELHGKNIIHRDIKPANIFMSKDRKTVKIGDFGASLMFRDDDDTLKRTKGTYTFFSPEMCKDEAYSGKSSDIWALGVTLYCFIFCEVPFNGASPVELFDRIQHSELTFPEQKEVSPLLRSFLQRVLCKAVLRRITLNEIRYHPWITMTQAGLQSEERLLGGSPPPGGPESAEHEEEELEVPDEAPDPAPMKVPKARGVLLVEDVFMARRLVSHMLSREILLPGTPVEAVGDGEDAIERCRFSRYVLVLMDVHMARVSGYQATASIRQMEKSRGWPEMPIVGMTADSFDDVSAMCLASGMNRVLSKPVRVSTLYRVAKQYGLPVRPLDEQKAKASGTAEASPVQGFTPPQDAAKHAYMVGYLSFLEETGGTGAHTAADRPSGEEVGRSAVCRHLLAARDAIADAPPDRAAPALPARATSAEQAAAQEAAARELGISRLPPEVVEATSQLFSKSAGAGAPPGLQEAAGAAEQAQRQLIAATTASFLGSGTAASAARTAAAAAGACFAAICTVAAAHRAFRASSAPCPVSPSPPGAPPPSAQQFAPLRRAYSSGLMSHPFEPLHSTVSAAVAGAAGVAAAGALQLRSARPSPVPRPPQGAHTPRGRPCTPTSPGPRPPPDAAASASHRHRSCIKASQGGLEGPVSSRDRDNGYPQVRGQQRLDADQSDGGRTLGSSVSDIRLDALNCGSPGQQSRATTPAGNEDDMVPDIPDIPFSSG